MDISLPGTYHHIQSTDAFPYILPHRSVNPSANSSIVLIHGAFSSHHGFEGVLTSNILSDYHLILPDLHSDGRDTSTGVDPFEISRVANLVAHLIRSTSKNSQAHLVGCSLGAHIAIVTAALHPEVVQGHTIFISGYNRFQPPSLIKSFIPYAFYGLNKIGSSGSDPSSNSEGEDDGNQRPKIACTMKLVKEIDGAIFGNTNSGESVIGKEGINARTCIVAATHWTSGDRVIHAQTLYDKIQGDRTGERERGHILVQNRKMKHPWDSIEPKLFAISVLAWIEGKDLPEGFEPC